MSFDDTLTTYAIAKEAVAQYHRDLWLTDRDDFEYWMRLFYKRNPTYAASYAARNRDRLRPARRLANARRRARLMEAEGSYTHDELVARYNDQDGKCAYCNKNLNGVYDADHVHPLSRGGSNYIENIVCACASCNRSKSDKAVEEWLAWLERTNSTHRVLAQNLG